MKLLIKEDTNHDIMELPTSERIDLFIRAWRSPFFKGSSTLDYMEFFNNQGFDTTNYTSEQFNSDWDEACDEWDRQAANEERETDWFDDDEEYEEEIETKEDAYRWLQGKLEEYGNTYHFPNEERYKLDRLIDRFGSTYFWRR